MEKLTLTIKETAKTLGISRNRAYAAARMGQIPIVTIGKRILVPQEALRKMLDVPVPHQPEKDRNDLE